MNLIPMSPVIMPHHATTLLAPITGFEMVLITGTIITAFVLLYFIGR